MSELDAERNGRRGFHLALGGILTVCFLPCISWAIGLQLPSPDPSGWRRRILFLAGFDTLLLVCALFVGAGSVRHEATPFVADGPRIGVALDRKSSPTGASVIAVASESPAERAGVHVGDQILSVDGVLVSDGDRLTKEIIATPAGASRLLHVRRGNEELDLSVVPARAKARSLFERSTALPKPSAAEILEQVAGYLTTLAVLVVLAVVAARRKAAVRPVIDAMSALLALVVVMFALRFVLHETSSVSLGSSLVAMCAAELAMVGVAGLAARRMGETPCVGAPIGTLHAVGLGLFYAIAGAMRAAVLISFATTILHLPNHPAAEVFGVAPSWGVGGVSLFVVASVVLAPLAEETLFRGVLLPWLLRWTTPFWAVVLSSIAFGAGHLFYGVSVLVPFVYGLALGWVRVRTGRLRGGILLHGILNAIATTVMLLAKSH